MRVLESGVADGVASKFEFDFAFALEFGFKKLTFGPISIPTSLK